MTGMAEAVFKTFVIMVVARIVMFLVVAIPVALLVKHLFF